MIPAIVIFKEALECPSEHFRTLRGIVPVRRDGEIVVSRTARFAEAEIRMDGCRWLVCAPLTRTATASVERTAEKLRYVDSDFLCEYRLLYSEMTFEDGLGRPCECDIVLQRLPEGEAFDRNTSYDSGRIGAMLDALRAEFERIGFTHGNLKPSNLIIGDDGRMHPIRYHYARIGQPCRDDFAPLYGIIGSDGGGFVGDVSAPYGATGSDGETMFAMHEGLRRICRGDRYGFIDESGGIAIPIRYLWADDFREGRAVVETENGMGLIDTSGREVIPAIYDDVCYDIVGGESTVRLDGQSTVFSYDGRQLDEFSK